ncbi:putative integral membrane protein [Patulibacter medicamentivorans]|uniref:Putative integral membrane protein n=1 Tax=Patulibacter medicamentivorans TaxID=1097667 RepID=H0E0J9_9ACTN|nr:phosphatase PAP2 family protein [Patulibacter medicamentivorans]EHN12818.1 putative integral membrane protein [Patulibacter medicamentivorans]
MPAFLTRPVRFLPNGILDALANLAIVMAAYWTYRYSRGMVDYEMAASTAFANADWIVSVERALHLDMEGGLQRFAGNVPGLLDGSSFMYINFQSTVTFGAMAYIYAVHNRAFGFVRNMFIVAWFIALVCYVLVPTAPPRLVPGLGIHDAVASFTNIDPDSHSVSKLFNPYAAVPSMHVGFALMIGVPLARLSKHKVTRWFWAVYPLAVTFVVMATGNHFFLDAVFGAMTVGVAAVVARQLGQLRPHAWQFGAAVREAPSS